MNWLRQLNFVRGLLESEALAFISWRYGPKLIAFALVVLALAALGWLSLYNILIFTILAVLTIEMVQDSWVSKKSWRERLGSFRFSYLPPLMVYLAYGVSALTGIVGTFYVKERLGISAAFIEMLGFWVGIPWALKMPVGHLVDLIWRFKGWLVVFGALLLATSLGTMALLIGDPEMMTQYASVETWYVFAVLLGPIGYVIQDVVADAMTAEAIPLVDETGNPIDEATKKSMHTTMQALGRQALIGGGALVAAVNIFLMQGVGSLPFDEKTAIYAFVYKLALVIPVISVLGVVLSLIHQRVVLRRLVRAGHTLAKAKELVSPPHEETKIDWWILGGGAVFGAFTVTIGLWGNIFEWLSSEYALSDAATHALEFVAVWNQEILFALSAGIVLFLMAKLGKQLSPEARASIFGISLIIFVYRAMPGSGAGSSWWMIDELGFDQEFLARLGFLGSVLTLAGIKWFRRLMATKSIPYVYAALTIAGSILMLPTIGMFFGLHEWTAALTNGLIDQRAIAIVDSTLASPLGQVAMIPMLAWTAQAAPPNLRATFFAIFASFSNLALSAASLGTKYMNQVYIVTREVKDATGVVTVPADYSELGTIFLAVLIIGLVLPLATIAFVNWRSRYGFRAFVVAAGAYGAVWWFVADAFHMTLTNTGLGFAAILLAFLAALPESTPVLVALSGKVWAWLKTVSRPLAERDALIAFLVGIASYGVIWGLLVFGLGWPLTVFVLGLLVIVAVFCLSVVHQQRRTEAQTGKVTCPGLKWTFDR